MLSVRPPIAPFGVIAVTHGESPHFGVSHLKDHVPKLIVVDGRAYQDFPFVDWTVKFGFLYDLPDVSHPRVDVF